MEHAKRMILVEPNLIDKMNQRDVANDPKSRLDIEMQNILKSKDDDRKKWTLYLQVLQRYLHFTGEDRQPFELPIITTPSISETIIKKQHDDKNVESEHKVAVVDQTSSEKGTHQEGKTFKIDQPYSVIQILSLIPKTYARKGELLLKLLSLSKNKIHWSDKDGTVFIDNNKIVGSNIVDLVNDTLRPLKRSDPIGWETFAKALKDLKIPLTYIGNQKRSSYINRLQLIDSGEVSDDETYSTPVSREKLISKLRRKVDWEKWTPY